MIYPVRCISDENTYKTYQFTTVHGILYGINFIDQKTPDDFQSSRVYEFSFEPMEKENQKYNDDRIKKTIIDLLRQFLLINRSAVYAICDTADSEVRGTARYRLFQRWAKDYSSESSSMNVEFRSLLLKDKKTTLYVIFFSCKEDSELLESLIKIFESMEMENLINQKWGMDLD